MKKMLKVLICVTFCIVLSTSLVYATGFDPSIFKPDPFVDNKLAQIGGAIISILQTIGTICAIITLLFMGMKLMLASPSERADVKSRAIPYIVGAVMLFSIVNLLAIMYEIMQRVAG